MDKQIKSFHITINGDLEAHAKNKPDAITVELMTDTNPSDAYFRDMTTHSIRGDAAMRLLRHVYPALEAEVKEQAARVMDAVGAGTEPVTQEELFQEGEVMGSMSIPEASVKVSGIPTPPWFSRDLLRVVLNIDPPGDSYPGPVRANALMSSFTDGWAVDGINWNEEAESLHREGLFASAAAHDLLMAWLMESEPTAKAERPDLGLKPEEDEGPCTCFMCMLARMLESAATSPEKRTR